MRDLAPSTALDSFHHVWWLLVISGVAVTVLTTRLPRHLAPLAVVEIVREDVYT
jgi:hypothetical protein